jgi:hypothetical protein
MSDKTIPFVITDRRKFNADGEPRESSEPTPAASASEPLPEPTPTPKLVAMPNPQTEPTPAAAEQPEAAAAPADEDLPAAPTPEQMEQSERAFQATAERLDLAIRSANPGADHPPALTFESLVQSVYMQAVLQLGGGTQQGEQPQIDILGARQSIDMLGILAAKTQGNLSKPEETLLLSALFELRLAFLEMTQALARSAAQRNPLAPNAGPAAPGGRPGPSIVR